MGGSPLDCRLSKPVVRGAGTMRPIEDPSLTNILRRSFMWNHDHEQRFAFTPFQTVD
jgi:hypothetical protein